MQTQINDGRFLTKKLPSRMCTSLVMSYAFTLRECDTILQLLSKWSYKFFIANKNALETMCVTMRITMFWGRKT